MKFHLKPVVLVKLFLSLVAMAVAFSFLYSNIKEGKPAMKIQLSQNGRLATDRDRSYNLMGNRNASKTTPAEEHCNEYYANTHRLQQDHPCVIDIIRRKYLHSPSVKGGPISGEHPDVTDPSAGQSAIILPYLNNKTEGFFVECGAGDGQTLSNTYYMEKQLKWQGILIEADRKSFSEILSRKRQTYALPVCLSLKPYPTEVSFYEDGIAGEIYGDKISDPEDMTTSDNITLTNVQCFPLYSILLAVGRIQVDYFSVDVEGSESQILMTIPWHKVDIKTLTVEVTSRRQSVVDSLTKYMKNQGYQKVGLMAGLGYYDLIFVQNKQPVPVPFVTT